MTYTDLLVNYALQAALAIGVWRIGTVLKESLSASRRKRANESDQ